MNPIEIKNSHVEYINIDEFGLMLTTIHEKRYPTTIYTNMMMVMYIIGIAPLGILIVLFTIGLCVSD